MSSTYNLLYQISWKPRASMYAHSCSIESNRRRCSSNLALPEETERETVIKHRLSCVLCKYKYKQEIEKNLGLLVSIEQNASSIIESSQFAVSVELIIFQWVICQRNRLQFTLIYQNLRQFALNHVKVRELTLNQVELSF